MGALGVVVIVGLIAGHIAYGRWLTNGIKPRLFQTSMSAEQLRSLFIDKVARTAWKVVDDGNPLVAQSSLVTGIRQQISLVTASSDGSTQVRVGPARWVTKWGVPKKGHTIRMRLDSFEAAVRQHDPALTVRTGELGS